MKKLSSKGVVVDFGAIIARQGDTVAIGNAKLNARGDQITHGGLVEKTAEELADQYYQNNPRAVSKMASISSLDDEVASPSAALSQLMQEMPDMEKTFNNLDGKKRRKTTDE